MSVRIAINGFGRIGRNVVRSLYESKHRSKITLVAINELASSKEMAYLLKYDTTHGCFSWNVREENEQLIIGKDSVVVLHEKEIKKLPWNKLGIDIVLDCTGVYGTRKHGMEHLIAGAKKVLFSHLGGNDLDTTIIYGVNHQSLNINHRIVSNGSCTTNCIVPIIKLLDDSYKINSGAITVIHSSMQDQKITDTYAYHSDLRKSRAASQSIVPVNTQLSYGISRIFPKFYGRFEANAVCVPVVNVIAINLSVLVEKKTKICELNSLLKVASENTFYGIIRYIKLPLVSSDFNHDSHSAIFDSTQTKISVDGHLVKVLVWCDNEWGFSNRMIDTTLSMAIKGFK